MIEVSNSLNDLSKKWDKVVVTNCKLSVEEFLDEDKWFVFRDEKD